MTNLRFLEVIRVLSIIITTNYTTLPDKIKARHSHPTIPNQPRLSQISITYRQWGQSTSLLQAQITANRQSSDQSERAYRRAGGSRSYSSTARNHIRCRYLRRDCAFSLSLTPDLSNASFRRCRSRNDLNSDINSGGSVRAIFKSPYIRACSRSGKIERGYRRFPIVATPFEMELNVPETT